MYFSILQFIKIYMLPTEIYHLSHLATLIAYLIYWDFQTGQAIIQVGKTAEKPIFAIGD